MKNNYKTMLMRLEYLKGCIWDKINEYEVDAEYAKSSSTKRIRRFHADDLREMMQVCEREMLNMKYEEVE